MLQSQPEMADGETAASLLRFFKLPSNRTIYFFFCPETERFPVILHFSTFAYYLADLSVQLN